jgi:hypothetical protein
MIYQFEILSLLAVVLSITLGIHLYRKLLAQPNGKSIMFFSAIILIVSIIILGLGYISLFMHVMELLALVLCFVVVIYYYKKVSSQSDNKSIAIFSSIIAVISIFTLAVGYLWFFYSKNIDWSFLRSDWQEVNSRGWNDVNYIRSKIGDFIMVVSGITNPIVGFIAFYYAMGKAMTGNPQPINQIEVLGFFIIPALVSVVVYIGLSNLLARVVRKIYRKITNI